MQHSSAMRMGAEIDITGIYRYFLWREWDVNQPRLGFVMLNPSQADATTDDATIRRCINFARSWGYGAIAVVNLFAYRATNPKMLRQAPDPIGPENDYYLLKAQQQVQEMIVAWGNWGTFHHRDQMIMRLLTRQGRVCCLGTTQSGQPRHPLYLSRNTVPVPFQAANLVR